MAHFSPPVTVTWMRPVSPHAPTSANQAIEALVAATILASGTGSQSPVGEAVGDVVGSTSEPCVSEVTGIDGVGAAEGKGVGHNAHATRAASSRSSPIRPVIEIAFRPSIGHSIPDWLRESKLRHGELPLEYEGPCSAGHQDTEARRTVELQDYLTVARKRWRVIALVTLVLLGLAAAASALSPKVYESRTQFFVSTTGASDSGALLQGSTFTQQRVKSYAQLLTTPRVLDRVAEATGTDPIDLDKRVTATTPPDTVLIDVAVRDPEPEAARAVAAAIAEVFPATVTELESTASGETSPVKVTVVQAPSAPESPVSPQPVRNIAIGLVLGLLSGLGAAVLRETLDRTVKTLEDLKAASNRPIIGVIAFDADAARRPLIVEVDPRSPRAEAFRALRTNLTFIDAADHPETIVVTSSLAGEGKSTVTMNLAMTMAQADANVCLIEADLRRPKVLEYMGMDGSLGLTDALIGHASPFDVLQRYGDSNLWVMGAGAIPPNPSELLGSAQMRAVLTELGERFDQVIIDAPPVLPVTDAVVLSKIVDGAIVVVGSGRVETDQLEQTLEALESVNGRVLGVILNRAPKLPGAQYVRYSYEYSLPEVATRREMRRARRTEPV